jgi:hypothetical protein
MHRLHLETLEDRCLLAFLAPVDYSVGTNPTAMVTADFNTDGHLDLATANSDGTCSILLGDGQGSFGATRQFATGASPSSIVVGDFDGDGKLDIVTADESLRYVTALLGNGDGTFRLPVTTDTTNLYLAGKPVLMAAVDYGGGRSELALATHAVPYDYESVNEVACVELLGINGQGRVVGPPLTYYSGNGVPVGLAVADLNANGSPDWVTVNDFYDNWTGNHGEVAVHLRHAGGTHIYETSPFPQGVAVGDFTGDGFADLIIDGQVRPGVGGGGFDSPISNPFGSVVAVADFNGDGRFDIDSGGNVRLSLGDGAFTEPVAYTGGSRAVGDFNGDGRTDMAALGSNAVLVSLNDGLWPPLTPTPPWVQIDDVTVTEGNTGTVEARFNVNLSWASTETITVAYATGDVSGIGNGGATADSDYQAVSGTLTFPPGETSKIVTVLVNGDREGEITNESFSVNLSALMNAVTLDGQGVGTIVDDEPFISIAPSMSRSEGNTGQTPFAFVVTLSSPSDVSVTADWATADVSATSGSDYQGASGTLIFAPGEMTKTIDILVNGDRLPEQSERFYVNLSGATSASYGGFSTGTIVDDEPRISVNNVNQKEGNGKKTTLFTFTVTLSVAYDQAVTMSYRTVNGTATTGDNDYIAQLGTLTFAPGETTKTITIEVKADNKREANELFYLDLFDNSSNSLFTKNRGIGTILNDD